MILATIYFIYKNNSVQFYMKAIYAVLVLIGLVLVSYFAIYMSSKYHKIFLFTLTLIPIISCLLWNIYAKTNPVSDYRVLIEGAIKMASGNFSDNFDKTNYFYFYNYQVGYAAYLALVIKLLGQTLLGLKIIEVIFITSSVLLIHEITKKLLGYKSAAIASIIYSLFIFNILGSSIINNQHLSALLMLLGLYFFIIGRKISVFTSGVVFAIMNDIRPIGIIILIGVAFFTFYEITKEKKWKKHLLKFTIFIISYFITISIINTAFLSLKLTPTPISNSNVPYYKFVIGLGVKNGSLFGYQTVNAKKTNVYFDLKSLNFDYNRYNKECVAFIKERIQDFKNTPNFLIEKMRFFMGEKDHQYTFALKPEALNSSFIKNLTTFGHFQYLFLLLFALLMMIIIIRKKTYELTLIHILFIGFILVHMFVEAQTRYRYEAYIFIIILGAGSIEYFLSSASYVKILEKVKVMLYKNT